MFTGIIEEIGTISAIKKSNDSATIQITCHTIMDDVHLGDSIAVNGVCLTVTKFDQNGFSADVMHETLNRSSLGKLSIGSKVNLERAMVANGRFGGHIVSGHIDGTGTITQLKQDGHAVWYTISCANNLLRYVVEKGSIAIDGISLTVAKCSTTSLSVSVIPHTLSQTILATKKVGDMVNLENDCIGKYVERLIGSPASTESKSKMTKEFLIQNGF
ncbi:riboflavin synthase [Clostridiales Family XIII bacterium PM5-7]